VSPLFQPNKITKREGDRVKERVCFCCLVKKGENNLGEMDNE
jgi:hypothetical protein